MSNHSPELVNQVLLLSYVLLRGIALRARFFLQMNEAIF